MPQFLNTNITLLREKLGIGKDAFGKLLGLKRGVIGSYETLNNPSEPKLALLSTLIEHFSKGSEIINYQTLVKQDLRDLELDFDAEAVIRSLKFNENKTINLNGVVNSNIDSEKLKLALRDTNIITESNKTLVEVPKQSLEILRNLGMLVLINN